MTMPAAASRAPLVELRYRIEPPYERWVLDDEPPMPESNPHRLAVQQLESQLRAWAGQHRPRALVGGSLAIRWDAERPQVGVDPDVYLVDPAPPEGQRVHSLLFWQKGHHAPQLAIEVVSTTNAKKDYVEVPAKYAACGVGELWVFDPQLAGPSIGGGPYRVQVWRRDGRGHFRRVYGGPGPALSRFVGAWLVAVESTEGALLWLADDASGRTLWPTEAELARTQGEAKGEAKGLRKGRREGKAEGRTEGLRIAIADLCELLGIALGPERRARLEAMTAPELDALRASLKQHRRWPAR